MSRIFISDGPVMLWDVAGIALLVTVAESTFLLHVLQSDGLDDTAGRSEVRSSTLPKYGLVKDY